MTKKKQIVPIIQQIIKTITQHQIIQIIQITQVLILNQRLIVFPYHHLQLDILN